MRQPRTSPTLSAVAVRCGVSLSTASKALNPHEDRCDISRELRSRILDVAAAMGYRRNAAASARARRVYGVVGLVWSRHAAREGLYAHLIEALALEVGRLGFRLLLTPVREAADWQFLQQAQRLDGVVVVERAPDAVLADLEQRDWPAVLLNLRSPRRLPQVLVDDRASARQAVLHLAAAGHRRLVYLPNPQAHGHCSEAARADSVRGACAEMGLDLESCPVAELPAMMRRWGSASGPTAAITYHYLEVPPLLRALRAAGIAIPAGGSVLSLDDVPWFEHLDPPLTAYSLPVEDLARIAAGLVADLINAPGQAVPLVQELPATLVVRGSVGPPPVGAPAAAN